MIIQIESTDNLVRIDGTLCRLWRGVTEKGIPCKVFVLRVAMDESASTWEADRDLVRLAEPTITTPSGGNDNGKWRQD